MRGRGCAWRGCAWSRQSKMPAVVSGRRPDKMRILSPTTRTSNKQQSTTTDQQLPINNQHTTSNEQRALTRSRAVSQDYLVQAKAGQQARRGRQVRLRLQVPPLNSEEKIEKTRENTNKLKSMEEEKGAGRRDGRTYSKYQPFQQKRLSSFRCGGYVNKTTQSGF